VRTEGPRRRRSGALPGLVLAALMCGGWALAVRAVASPAAAPPPVHAAPHALGTLATADVAVEADRGCVSCHENARDPHPGKPRVSCVGCHGGDGRSLFQDEAHPTPRFPAAWESAANPRASYTLLNRESPEWVRFVNPGDLRAAPAACGRCHAQLIRSVQKGPMTNSAQVYSTALYNNGTVPFKDALFAENYSPLGEPQAIRTIPPPTPLETARQGILPILFPVPRFEVGQPGMVFRANERGGGAKSELGNPNRFDVPGLPDIALSNRGFGTQGNVDPVFVGIQKTRLNDPVMSFLGTNDTPGDYRSSGCSACHVIYANDRSEHNSGRYARYGNRGRSHGDDPTIPKHVSGHPIRHEFTRSIPSSQCITCHVHNGNGFLNTFLGYMWWDQQTEGEYLYPREQRHPSARDVDEAGRFNPEEAAARGLWSDPEFLESVSEMNPRLRKVQLSDYHGHGWIFRKVYKRDRKGNLLDAAGDVVPFEDPDLWEKAVHLMDVHLERGMHCVDCHFEQDNHGSGRIYGDRRAAVEIDCIDCHGTARAEASLTTSGPAARGDDLTALRTPWDEARFERTAGGVRQRSMVDQGRVWEVPQVRDVIDPASPRYNRRAHYAKTVQKDGASWGDLTAGISALAHTNEKMACFSCHSSWTTNCFGCHLSAKTATRRPSLHNEGGESQVYASYNPQVLRSDGYMLGIDGTVMGHRVAPVRSSSAVTLSVQNANREWIINQVPTISSAGYNGNAFNTHAPHTVRGRETKQCSDCHVSEAKDNNAWIASVLMQGTNQVNFMTRYAYLAEEKGVSAVAVTEQEEPQAVYGSHLHRIAYPDFYAEHQGRKGELQEAHRRGGGSRQVQLYGEWLLSVEGKDGFQVYDVANVANKGFARRIVTTPFASENMRVDTEDATGLAIGSPAPLDPNRIQLSRNEEQPVAAVYGYAFVSDRREGLISIDMKTLADGVPTNNGISRAATFDAGGRLSGANAVTLAGNCAYVTTPRGLYVVDVENPLRPRLLAQVEAPILRSPRRVAIQFRYAFVLDDEGLKVLDVTLPDDPAPIPGAVVPLRAAHDVYVSRTYAYVAAGGDGLAIVDVEQPEQPRLDQTFDADGRMDDARSVKLGMVNAGLFAFVADGRNGLKVVELAAPDSVPGNMGFSPRPSPRLVAWRATGSPALWISEGYRRDRGVDESGNQVAIFGRRGARPFNLEEQRRLYLRNGELYTVTDEPPAR